jgi:2-polyprenyl-6-methoxyphenol hydroxylase-like FAD-dependent oxidoreductase
MITNKNILISGAGITGLTLAYWLQTWGFSPTIVEKRSNLEARGYLIDFYGSGYDVAEKMEVLDSIRARSDQYRFKKVSFVDEHGRERAALDVVKFRALLHQRYFSLMRGDLESAIYESVEKSVPIRFGVSINKLDSQSDGVSVYFSDGTSQVYDLVIGADGIHSNVRNQVWGDEAQFSHFLGFYVACSVIENFFDQPDVVFGHFEPNIQTTVYAIGKNKLATFFAFRSAPLSVHGREERMDALVEKVGNGGWVIPQLLENTKKADEFFFDAAVQIELDHWYVDRIALAGDACQCLTLLAGQGASMGMAGAYMLAEELHKAAGDYKVAFPAYQQRLRPEIERRQKDARGLSGSFVPKNKFEVALTHFFLNISFLPGFSALFAKQIGVSSLIK